MDFSTFFDGLATLWNQIWAQILPAYFGTVILGAYFLASMGLRSKAGKWFVLIVVGWATFTGMLFYWLNFIPGSQPGQYFFTWTAEIALYEVILNKFFPARKAEEKMDKLKTSMK